MRNPENKNSPRRMSQDEETLFVRDSEDADPKHSSSKTLHQLDKAVVNKSKPKKGIKRNESIQVKRLQDIAYRIKHHRKGASPGTIEDV